VAFPECFIEQPSAAQILSKAPLICNRCALREEAGAAIFMSNPPQ
jgi:hypothetical protein